MVATTSRAADRAQQHPAALRTLETRAAQDATRPLAQALAVAQQDATARWIRATTRSRTPDPDTLDRLIATVRQQIATAFRGQGTQAQRAAQRAAAAAVLLGARQAADIAAEMSGQPTPTARPQPPGRHGPVGPDAQAAIDQIPAAVEEEHQHALALLTAATLTAMGAAGLAGVFSRAGRAVTRIARAVAVTVTSAAAWGVASVARAIGPTVRLLWVAEPGACPACAAYAGRTILPGGEFPGSLSLAPRRTLFTAPIAGPPRHPHCRCSLIPWLPAWHTGGTSLPDLLRRRARTGGR